MLVKRLEHTPEILVVEYGEITCPACDGSMFIDVEEPCPVCRATGVVDTIELLQMLGGEHSGLAAHALGLTKEQERTWNGKVLAEALDRALSRGEPFIYVDEDVEEVAP